MWLSFLASCLKVWNLDFSRNRYKVTPPPPPLAVGSGTTPCNQTHHIPMAKRVNKDYKHLHVPSVRLWGQMSSHQTKQKSRVSRTFWIWRGCTEILDTSVWRCEGSLCCELVFSHLSQSLTHCMLSVCVCVCACVRACARWVTSVISDSLSHHGL